MFKKVMTKFLAWLGLSALIVQSGPVALAQGVALSDRQHTFSQIVDAFNEMEPTLAYMRAQVDKTVFDPSALKEKIGGDIVQAFDFIQQEVAYIPYRGALKGHQGVLVERAGNALDRALLLAYLLEQSGREIRITETALDRDDAIELAEQAFVAGPVVPEALALTPELLRVTMDFSGQTPDLYKTEIESSMATMAAQETLGSGDIDLAVEQIIAAQGLEPTTRAMVTLDNLAEIATQHFVVEIREDGGDWVALDPASGESEIGVLRGDVKQSWSPDAVPDELEHVVDIGVSLNVRDQDGSVSSVEILERGIRSREFALESISMSSGPLDTHGSDTEEAKKSDVYGLLLSVQGNLHNFVAFNLAGDVVDAPEAQGASSNALQVLSQNLSQIGGDDEAENPNQLVGLTIEFTIRGPGYQDRQSQKRHFAAQSEAPTVAESARAISFFTNITVVPHEIDPQFAMLAHLKPFLDPTALILPVIAQSLDVDYGKEIDTQLLSRPVDLITLAASARLSRLDDSRPDTAVFVGRPSLIAREYSQQTREGKVVVESDTIDLISLGHVGAAKTESGLNAVARAILKSGVGWTRKEADVPGTGFGQRRTIFDDIVGYEGSESAVLLEASSLSDLPPEMEAHARQILPRSQATAKAALVPAQLDGDAFHYWETDIFGTTIGRDHRGRGSGSYVSLEGEVVNKDIPTANEFRQNHVDEFVIAGWLFTMAYQLFKFVECAMTGQASSAKIFACGSVLIATFSTSTAAIFPQLSARGKFLLTIFSTAINDLLNRLVAIVVA